MKHPAPRGESDPVYLLGVRILPGDVSQEHLRNLRQFQHEQLQTSVVANLDRCKGCLKCLYVCPDFAITISDEKPEGCDEAPASLNHKGM
jgi:NAD-dependent dihydropyrimidine dehydrogenase PreA subunit